MHAPIRIEVLSRSDGKLRCIGSTPDEVLAESIAYDLRRAGAQVRLTPQPTGE